MEFMCAKSSDIAKSREKIVGECEFYGSKTANNEAIDKRNAQKTLVKAWEGLTL